MAAISCIESAIVVTSGSRLMIVSEGESEVKEIPKVQKEDTSKKKEGYKAKKRDECESASNRILASCVSPSGDYFAVGDDEKFLHVFATKPKWRLISSRAVAKRCMALTFTHSEAAILVADKTGDVYRFSLTEPDKGGELLLGHLSMILDLMKQVPSPLDLNPPFPPFRTCHICRRHFCFFAFKVVTADDSYVVTCDRDEKVRVSHFPNAYNIHAFCLGHTEFVSQLLYLDQFQCLLTGSGDGTICTWGVDGKQRSCVRCQKSKEDDTPAPVKRLAYSPQLKMVIAAFYGLGRLDLYTLEGDTSCMDMKWSCDLCLEMEPWDICLDKGQRLWVLQSCEKRPVRVFTLQMDADGSTQVTNTVDPAIQPSVDLLNSCWDFFKVSLDVPDLYCSLQKVTMGKHVEEYKEKKQQRIKEKMAHTSNNGQSEPAQKKIKQS